MEFILSMIISSLVSSSVISIVIKMWTERFIEHRFSKQLEKFKAEITGEQAATNVVYSSYSAARTVAHSHTQSAVQELWKYFVEIRSNEPPVFLYLRILNPEGVRSLEANKNVNVRASFDKSSIEKLLDLPCYSSAPTALRLYAGDPLWSCFIGYRTFVGLVTMIMKNEKGWKYAYFLDIHEVKELLQELLGKDFQKVEEAGSGHYEKVWLLIEEKFLTEARRIVMGEAEADTAVAQARRILNISREIQLGESRD